MPNMNSLFLGTHSVSVRYAELDVTACATQEEWVASDQQGNKREQDQVENRAQLGWLVNMRNKDSPVSARPGYKAGSGRVAQIGQTSTMTTTVFSRPKGILDTKRKC